MKIVMAAIIFFVAVMGASDLGAQKLYTWIDENGVTHITDDPPPQILPG